MWSAALYECKYWKAGTAEKKRLASFEKIRHEEILKICRLGIPLSVPEKFDCGRRRDRQKTSDPIKETKQNQNAGSRNNITNCTRKDLIRNE